MSETTSNPSSLDPSILTRLPTLPSDILKRLIDLFASALGLLLISPILIWIALRIRRDSPGPVFYRSPRLGKGGRVFGMLKFRTMYERPESYQGPRVTAQDDDRITPYGRWLRDTKLNELPQLWNVLKGDMSLVAPRPEDPSIADAWPDSLRSELLSVRPGVTSPASVLYRDEETRLNQAHLIETYLSDILPDKLRLDQLYVRHRSLFGDLDIIFYTLLTLLPKVQKIDPPEGHLYLGPLRTLTRQHLNWFTIDTLTTLLAISLTGLAFRIQGPLDIGWPRAILLALAFSMLFSLVGMIFGVHRIEWSRAAASDAFDLLPGAILATTLALLANHLIHTTYDSGRATEQATSILHGFYWSAEPLLPSAMLITASLMACIGFVVVRYRARLLTGLATRWINRRGLRATAGEPTLLVGGGRSSEFAAWLLTHTLQTGLVRPIGLVDDDLFKQHSRIHGLEVLGSREDIPAIVAKHDVGVIVFAIHNISALERQRVLNICKSTPARLLMFPDIQSAISQVTRRDPGSAPHHDGGLPCHICLTKTSPITVDEWLQRFEILARQSDTTTLIEEIAALRSRLSPDVAIQLRAIHLAPSQADIEENHKNKPNRAN